jgi:hypothetical protein
LIWITRPSRHEGGEILNFADGISSKQEFAEFLWVDPAIRSFAKRAVIEIEAVNVDVCYQFAGSRNAEAARRRLRARLPKQPGGYGAKIREYCRYRQLAEVGSTLFRCIFDIKLFNCYFHEILFSNMQERQFS